MKKKFQFVLVALWENEDGPEEIKSNIAKLELVRLKNRMDELGVDLKLCVIYPSEKVTKMDRSSSLPDSPTGSPQSKREMFPGPQ